MQSSGASANVRPEPNRPPRFRRQLEAAADSVTVRCRGALPPLHRNRSGFDRVVRRFVTGSGYGRGNAKAKNTQRIGVAIADWVSQEKVDTETRDDAFAETQSQAKKNADAKAGKLGSEKEKNASSIERGRGRGDASADAIDAADTISHGEKQIS